MIDVRIEPKLRTLFVADDKREFENLGMIFGEWIATLPPAERTRIIDVSKLSAKQCKQFWTYIGRADHVPKYLQIYVYCDDIEKLME